MRYNVLSLDLEMAAPYGFPSADRDPIIIISTAFYRDGEIEEILFSLTDEEFENKNDSRIIKEFIDLFKKLDPDIIVGYNQDSFDWPYIRKRCEINKIPLILGRDDSTIIIREEQNFSKVNIIGRLNVDLYKIVNRELNDVKIKKLENVAEYLNVKKIEDRTNLAPKEITEFWKSEEKRNLVYKYAKDDVDSTLKIALKLLPAQIHLANLIGIPLDELSDMGRGRMVENYLTYRAFEEDELVPYKRGEEVDFEGGFVLESKANVYDCIADIDFSALYPSLIIKYNISPDTYVESYNNPNDVYISPEVNHAFLKYPDGFYKRIMNILLNERNKIRSSMKSLERNSEQYQLLDIQQYNLKILINSFWGYVGWAASKLFKLECAESITAWGRQSIKKAANIAETNGFKVLAGDTDSIFIKYNEFNDLKLLKPKVEDLISKIGFELGLEIKVDEYFKSILFTGAKKRYAAINEFDERVDRGFEVRRGDWSMISKKLQSEILDIVLREKDIKKAIKLTNDTIKKLIAGEINPEELVIWVSLTKNITDYNTKQAHVIAARRALTSPAQIRYAVGSKIPYVIYYGTGRISDRAFPYEVIDSWEGTKFKSEGIEFYLDTDYYRDKQIIAPSLRILGIFGITEFDLGTTTQTKLDI